MADRGGFISEADRSRLDAFPAEIEDPAAYFTLLPEDIELLQSRRDDAGRLAGGLQIGALRLLGFVPTDLTGAPLFVTQFLGEQLGVNSSSLGEYSSRDQTRSDHVAVVERHLGFRRADRGELKALGDWLVERALEHDRPSTLFSMACEHLRAERIVRPGVTVVERAVLAARQRATHETYLRLAPQLDAERRELLMSLLDVDPDTGVTPWTWIRGVRSNGARSNGTMGTTVRPRLHVRTECGMTAAIGAVRPRTQQIRALRAGSPERGCRVSAARSGGLRAQGGMIANDRALVRSLALDFAPLLRTPLLPVATDTAEALYRVVDAAYEQRSIALSSNLHPAGFDELMPTTIANATVDRLLHHAHIVLTAGDSIRLTQATSGQGVIPLIN